ncbi:MAG TPA: DinB family protein [Terriglobales bacterium]|nr:DinB family protein [Terriglobales bacterium]
MREGLGVSFDDLLAYEEEEMNHWEEWFRANAAALSARVELKHTLRNRLFHIFSVGQRNAERLLGEPQTTDKNMEARSLEQLFDIGRLARTKYRKYLAGATEDQISTPHKYQSATMGEFTATPRKLLLHGVIHSIRHWGQVATLLRQQGYEVNFKHDVIFSKVIE